MKQIYQNHIFPWILKFSMSKQAMQEKRAPLLQNAKGEVLEIGFGTGLNFGAYPKSIKKITAIDINPGMKPLAQKLAKKSGLEVEMVIGSAENLPFLDSSFDTVVSTWTFCSIPDIDLAMKEIYRVLRPGGKLIFIEHGANKDEKIRHWQNRVAPIWKIFGNGCHLNRDIKSIISRQPFLIKNYAEYSLPKTFSLASYTYEGMMRKN